MDLSLRRLRLGEWLAAAGGAVLLVSLFLDWYAIRGLDEFVPGASGFESFSVLDLFLVLVAVVALALAVAQGIRDSPTIPVGLGVIAVVLGFVAAVLVAYRILNQPGDNEFVEVRAGAWVGLAAALAVTLGGWLSIASEDARGLPPGPHPELRPPP